MFRPHPIKRFESKLLSITDLGNDVCEFTFSTYENFVFTAGQFVTIFFKDGERTFRRQYSICSSPLNTDTVSLCIKNVKGGPGSAYLWNLQVDDTVDMMAPLGVFVLKHSDKPITFVSTGTGIGPFKSMIEDMLAKGYSHRIRLVCGYRHDCLYFDHFTALAAAHDNFEFYPILSQPSSSWEGEVGRVQKVIEKIVDPADDYYICGLFAMIKESAQLLEKSGVPRKQIFFERYD